MKTINILKQLKQFREFKASDTREAQTLEDLLLQVGMGTDIITREQALSIPSVSACTEAISNTIAMLPINLYQVKDGKVTSVQDNRVKLLNLDTKDTLNSFQFKKQLIEDYLLSGVGYSYINKQGNNIKSLNYVDNSVVSITKNADPIFKSYDILVNGQTYRDFEFIKLTRKTKDGATGIGIVQQNNSALSVAYQTQEFEKILIKTGGNKRGFLKAEKKLDKDALTALRTAWNNLYNNNTSNMMVLNNGVDFKEGQNSPVEMQLNETKKTNSIEICKMFNIPKGILEGNATEQDNSNYIKFCILPIQKAFEIELNRELLLESEKDSFYFATDNKELEKGDLLKRFTAYEIAIRAGITTIDEVRYIENMEDLGLNFLKLGLDSVLYNAKTKDIFVTNTGMTFNMDNPVIATPTDAPTPTDTVVATDTLTADVVDTVEEVTGDKLNGAQVQSLIEVIKSVKSGELGSNSALTIIVSAFGINEEKAKKILNDAI